MGEQTAMRVQAKTAMRTGTRNADIARLRHELATLEGVGADARVQAHTRAQVSGLSFGVGEIDRHLDPHLGCGLRAGRIHEFKGSAALALAVVLAGRAQNAAKEKTGNTTNGDIIWCTPKGRHHGLYPPGLIAFGLDPRRIIHVHANAGDDLHWAAEEALRSKAIHALIMEATRAMSLTTARRLQLAAEAGATPALIIHPLSHTGRHENTNDTAKPLCPAATTRWHISHLPPQTTNRNKSYDDPQTGKTRHAFALDLIRNKAGDLNAWQVYWDETAHRLRLAAAPRNGSHNARQFEPAR